LRTHAQSQETRTRRDVSRTSHTSPFLLPLLALLTLLVAATLIAAGGPVAALAAEAGAQGAAGEAGKEKPSLSHAPDFTADGVDGRTYRLRDLLSKGPVFLDFWTTYCKPCMLELPQMQKIWERYRGQGFTLLGVAADDQRTAAKIGPTIASRGFKFPILTDPDHRVASLYNVLKYPTSILIAPDGRIIVYRVGYSSGDEKKVEEEIRALLGAGKAAAPGTDKGTDKGEQAK
jgi:cytochrome c biogenesis protein CcmG, thiol:disulfide interchange protein DsbE